MISFVALNNKPNQSFALTVPGDIRTLKFNLTLSYNTLVGYWVMGIYDSSSNPIVIGIPLVAGEDLLGQYQYMDIGSVYLIDVGDPSLPPDDASIGNYALRWELT